MGPTFPFPRHPAACPRNVGVGVAERGSIAAACGRPQTMGMAGAREAAIAHPVSSGAGVTAQCRRVRMRGDPGFGEMLR